MDGESRAARVDFPGARQPADRNEACARRRQIAERSPKVPPSRCDVRFTGGRGSKRCPLRGHHGADAGSQAQKERQSAKRFEVAGKIAKPQIAVQHGIGGIAVTALVKIHQQKGKVVERVDDRQLLIELDGVERRRLALPEHDVTEMQVSMASPDLPGLRPPAE